MPDLRDMELLSALARHGHFARAAEACGISQPAFSARIRNLEHALGVAVVKRGNRYHGLTREGEIALAWARKMLADLEGLRQDIDEAKGALEGQLTLGAVPSALSYAARVPVLLRAVHPRLVIRILSASSTEIRAGLEDYSFDAGLTYLDIERPAASRVEPIYAERYVLLVPAALAPRAAGEASWAEAAALPLALLTPNMRNRRILDEAFAAAGVSARPVMESNTFTTALLQVTAGVAATIAPEVLASAFTLSGETVALPLVAPRIETPVGLVTLERAPEPPAVRALRAVLSGGVRPSRSAP
ncbi:MAG: LysR family transcriptional regulator [Paracoccaceae bacterium]